MKMRRMRKMNEDDVIKKWIKKAWIKIADFGKVRKIYVSVYEAIGAERLKELEEDMKEIGYKFVDIAIEDEYLILSFVKVIK